MVDSIPISQFLSRCCVTQAVTELVETCELAFTGDTGPEFITAAGSEDALRARLLIMELSFIDDRVSPESAHVSPSRPPSVYKCKGLSVSIIKTFNQKTKTCVFYLIMKNKINCGNHGRLQSCSVASHPCWRVSSIVGRTLRQASSTK